MQKIRLPQFTKGTMERSFIFSGMVTFFVVTTFTDLFSANHSFDQSQGALAVDYANYLSKHNIVFNTPITSPASGLTIGNGRVGAMVWNTNGITIQVTGVDASPQTIFSEGWLNLATSPRMDSGYTTFQQTLQLYDGLITTRYDANRLVKYFRDYGEKNIPKLAREKKTS
jgi:hypothetical protein